MRKIKFRAKYDKDWVYGYYIGNDDNKVCIVPIDSIDYQEILIDNVLCYHCDSETLGQFTSLYDKDNKEIYEGDILDWNGLIVEVRFVRGVFEFLINGNYDDTINSSDTSLFSKVIGNIHDNPNLIKNMKTYE